MLDIIMINTSINVFRLLLDSLLGRLGHLFLMPSFVSASQLLLNRLGRFLFFLAAAGFLSVVLIACAGGGGSGGSSSGSANNGSMNGDPGDNGPGNGGGDGQGVSNVSLTFAPIRGGFQIGNQSDFGDFTSLKITATSGGQSEERTINIDEFADDSYDFTGLADLDWKFQISGILSDSREQEVDIVFVWQENRDDHAGDGIRSGVDTDGDRRADSVDEDDDNDGVGDGIEARGCAKLEDCDSDSSEDGMDIDDDGDGLIEITTAAHLDEVRYALDGSGRRSTDGGALDSTGCGGTGGITSCNGYELVANISLAAYADANGGKGWQPLAHDIDNATDGCQGTAFNGTFDGNGFRISDLTINRPNEDCVGLFGHTIEHLSLELFRNLSLHTETIVGDDRVGSLVGYMVNATITSSSISIGNISGRSDVGGLVGNGLRAEIISSSVEVGKVSGTGDNVGGLVGDGTLARIYFSSVEVGKVSGTGDNVGGLVGDGVEAGIYSSSVVTGEVSGRNDVGGLVGEGETVRIISSSVVAAEVSGSDDVGGLVGYGVEAGIYSSSVVAAEVNGSDDVGGLMGNGEFASIHSSSVVVGNLSGNNNVGGLAGVFDSGKVAYSYVVSGSNTSMLGGQGSGSGTGVASYWDSETSGRDTGNYGEAKDSNELRMPIDYGGIYADWDEHIDIFDKQDVSFAVWCDENGNRRIEADERNSANLIWDFGESDEYPAIRCTPLRPDDWRNWWSLEGTPAKPQLDRARLDQLLP